eukprot:4465902-Pyramimonas_sp.AAC.2
MVKDLETPVGLETSSLASEAECICVASIEEVNDNAVCSEATRKAFESGGGCGCPLNCSQGCETSRRSSTAWLPREIPVILQRRNSSPENGQAAPLGGHCLGGQAVHFWDTVQHGSTCCRKSIECLFVVHHTEGDQSSKSDGNSKDNHTSFI